MCPITYCTMIRSKDNNFSVRIHMVEFVRKNGLKATAKAFGCSRNTVRLWFRRYEGQGTKGLQNLSCAPKHIPHKTPLALEKEIVAFRKKLPTWSAPRLKRDFELPCGASAIQRIYHAHHLIKKRRRKHHKKNDLRKVKAEWYAFQQTCADTKDLKDISNYWPQMKDLGLPTTQYTAREVRTGLTFLGYADELCGVYAELFGKAILQKMRECGIDTSKVRIQSDNGSEFIGNWQAKGPSAFTITIESEFKGSHNRIPPGAYTYNSDVETFHRLEEDEFYDIEKFSDRPDYKNKITSYLIFFNTVRKNKHKGDKSPLEILKEIAPNVNPNIAFTKPFFLNEMFSKKFDSPIKAKGGQVLPNNP